MDSNKLISEAEAMSRVLDSLVDRYLTHAVVEMRKTIHKAIGFNDLDQEANQNLDGAIWSTIAKISGEETKKQGKRFIQEMKKRILENPTNVPDFLRNSINELSETPEFKDKNDNTPPLTTTKVEEA